MLNMTKEGLRISPQERESFEHSNQKIRDWDEKLRKLTPVCPDGSKEIGHYDLKASSALSRYVYKTENGKYFYWNENLQVGGLVSPNFYPFIK